MKKIFHYLPQCLIIITFMYSLTHLSQINQMTEASFLSVQKLFFALYFLMLLFSIANDCHLFVSISKYIGKPIAKILHLNQVETSIYLASVFSGYPTFAKLIKDAYLKQEISKESANHLLKICSHGSVGFIVISLGQTLYHDMRLGWLVFLAQVSANFILAKILKRDRLPSAHPVKNKTQSMMTILKTEMKSCLAVFIYIYGFMLVFNILSAIFFADFPILHGLLEFSQGCLELKDFPLFYQLILSSGMIGFSSLSVIFQVASLLDGLSLDVKGYISCRFCQAFLCMTITAVLYWFLY